jgi:hypothetical protein
MSGHKKTSPGGGAGIGAAVCIKAGGGAAAETDPGAAVWIVNASRRVRQVFGFLSSVTAARNKKDN